MSVQATLVHEADCELEGWEEPEPGLVTWRTLFSGERTPTRGLVQGVAEVRATLATRPGLHRHDHAETYYILSGRGVIDLAGELRPLAPGDAVFIPGNTWHAAWSEGGEPLRILYTFPADSFAEVVYEFADEG
ncbi:MAG: cupin domain-containing protein [Phenylobacterium sp.]